ncbi:MAG: CTP synthase [Myxococcales bacterium]|nr:CTP synthase [Myxococcales bacterium]
MKAKQIKYIFITGGVVSSLGKGLSAASIGALMEARGLKVTLVKLDPYINVDPGTMNPFQHGEVFVTDDGAETDLDLGHYERFTSITMSRSNNFTSGQVYDSVISKERRGEYLGGTVQVIPHITDEIKAKIRSACKNIDLAIVEVGGTVGDIESLPFLEAIRQMKLELGSQNAINIHVTLVPYIAAAGELKSKPTQHSVKVLREIGIQPDVLLCRSEKPINEDIKRKISLFCNVPVDGVVSAPDLKCIYELPVTLHGEGLDHKITELLNIWSREPDLSRWQQIVAAVTQPEKQVEIGIVGKYVDLVESYKSLNEALIHGGVANNCRVKLKHIDAESLVNANLEEALAHLDGILVPGGFGERGVEGKIHAIRFARERNIPFFGICLGLQLAVVEFARNMCDMVGANSTEFDKKSKFPVIDLMNEQRDVVDKGATMRLGAYPCIIQAGSLAAKIYRQTDISERHRHRYEVNNKFRGVLQERGLSLCGMSPNEQLIEMIELKNHRWYLATQFHPEYKSRPWKPHPIFTSFIEAALAFQRERAVPGE